MSSLTTSLHATNTTGTALPISESLPRLSVPHAILLDFGGVIFRTSKHANGRDRLAQLYEQLLNAAGFNVCAMRLRESIDAGLTALKHWKNASSRRLRPRELSQREVIADFMVSDLPDGPRELLATHAAELVKQQNLLISGHERRPGIRKLVSKCQEQNILLGIVSNAHSGASHREILQQHGLHDAFDVQIYSDEVEIRKPHPGMIQLAADALGVSPEHCWYVGDTQDRDVIAGRRSQVGAVILTRCHHTDTPPFPVRDRPDAVFDTPAGIVKLLEYAQDPVASSVSPLKDQANVAAANPQQVALLIDHGGVISTSEHDPVAHQGFLHELAELLGPAVNDDNPADIAQQVLDNAITGHKAAKATRRDANDHVEVTPLVFWGTYGAIGQNAQVTALLRSQAHRLTLSWGQAKSRRVIRSGIPTLFRWCADHSYPVVVVSNTISGASVRTQLTDHGIADYVTAVVASDEFGLRKPHPNIVRAALAIADTAPQSAFFLGDKPENDASAAAQCGIGHRVLVAGGSTSHTELAAAVTDGTATHLIDEPGDLLTLMQQFSTTHS